MTYDLPELRRSALFFSVSFLQALDNQLIPVLLPLFRQEMPGAPAGQLLTAYALACGIVPFIATVRGRSDQVKSLAVAALLVMAVGAFAFAATTAFPARLALRAGAGAASGVLSVTLLLGAARIQDEKSRARQFTVINAGYLSALVLGVPLGARVAKHFDSASIYTAIGAVAVVLAFLFARAALNPGREDGPVLRRSLLRLLSHRPAARILIATGIVGAAMAGPVGYLGSFLSAERGLGIDAIGAVYMWAGVGPLLAMPIAGRIIARWRPHRVAIAGSLIISAPILFFPTLATSLAPAAAVMLVCVLIETVRRAALQGALTERVPPTDLPRYLAYRGVIVQLGLAVGYALAEVEFSGGGFHLVCRIAALLSIGAAGILLTAGSPERQPSLDPQS